jgi:hypothetical protein
MVADYGEKETEHNWERVEEGFKKATLLVEKQSAEVLCGGLKKIKPVLVPSVHHDTGLFNFKLPS